MRCVNAADAHHDGRLDDLLAVATAKGVVDDQKEVQQGHPRYLASRDTFGGERLTQRSKHMVELRPWAPRGGSVQRRPSGCRNARDGGPGGPDVPRSAW